MSLMCHEVRTPLNGCLASAEMLLEMPLQVCDIASEHWFDCICPALQCPAVVLQCNIFDHILNASCLQHVFKSLIRTVFSCSRRPLLGALICLHLPRSLAAHSIAEHLSINMQEEQRDLAKTIRVSGSILLSTVSNFLDFFKMEAGKQLDVVRTEITTKVLLITT